MQAQVIAEATATEADIEITELQPLSVAAAVVTPVVITSGVSSTLSHETMKEKTIKKANIKVIFFIKCLPFYLLSKQNA